MCHSTILKIIIFVGVLQVLPVAVGQTSAPTPSITTTYKRQITLESTKSDRKDWSALIDLYCSLGASFKDKKSSKQCLLLAGKAGVECYRRFGDKQDLRRAIRNLNEYTTLCRKKPELMEGLRAVKEADALLKNSVPPSDYQFAAQSVSSSNAGAAKEPITESKPRRLSQEASASDYVDYTKIGNPYWMDYVQERSRTSASTTHLANGGRRTASDTTDATVIPKNNMESGVATSSVEPQQNTDLSPAPPTDKKAGPVIATKAPTIQAQKPGVMPPIQIASVKPSMIDVPRVKNKKKAASSSKRVYTIVIDPGHGGKDPGAVSRDGKLKEKDITLAVAKRIADKLNSEGKIKVTLTRDSDVFLPLSDRTAFANNLEVDLFVSLHCNSTNDSVSRGMETYVLSAAGSRKEIRAAARENGIPIHTMNDLQATLLDLMVTSKKTESSELAEHISLGLGKFVPSGRQRGIKKGPFYVLLGAKMPAVLIECAFISSDRERAKLSSSGYLDKIASGIAQGLVSYLAGL